MAFAVGKRVVAESESTDRRPRSGVVEEVLRGDPSPRYRIRWDDGHESIYTPASGALAAAVAGCQRASINGLSPSTDCGAPRAFPSRRCWRWTLATGVWSPPTAASRPGRLPRCAIVSTGVATLPGWTPRPRLRVLRGALPAPGQSGCRELVAPTCDAGVVVM